LREHRGHLIDGASSDRVVRTAIIAVAVLYVLFGLVGHDPWKQDETYVTSIIQNIDRSDDWVVPRSAGRPFMEKPPLYFVVAEETADLFDEWLPLHDAARLSDALWMFIVIGCLAAAGRLAWPSGPQADVAAILALISSAGLVVHAHTLLVDVALLAGFALALLGLLWMRERPAVGGLLLGTGAGAAFLAKGLLGPGCLGLTLGLLALLSPMWRSREIAKGSVIALAAILPWVLVWPVALYLRAPALFDEWLWQQNVGRFFGYSHLGAAPEAWYYFRVAPLFAFPVLAFAAWAVWTRRRSWRNDAALQLCAVLPTVTFATLCVAGSMRALYLLPILLPLSLLAAAGVEQIPARWQRWSSQVSLGVYSTLAAGIWLLYLAGAHDAMPAWLPVAALLPPPPIPLPDPTSVAVAVLATSAWCANASWRGGPLLALRNWAFGLTLAWVLVATLLMPWINEAKAYRSMFEDMRHHLPAGFDCVKSYRLGESEAAMLEYEGKITAVRAEDHPGAMCQLIWVQGSAPASLRPVLAESRLIWSGHRPGDAKEVHRLFAR
jgi:4-amino-4-deoxy-L-arabinose transferase-like glycosyltransferase